MSIPKFLQAMTEEEILADLENFRVAIEDRLSELKIARTERNHSDARARVCLRHKQPTNVVYSADLYTLDLSLNHGEMEKIVEKPIEHYRDDSGDRKNNRPNTNMAFGSDPIALQEYKGCKFELKNLENELRYDPPRGKSDPRIIRRDELLAKIDNSDFIFDDGDRDRKIKKFRTRKAEKLLLQIPLETPDRELVKFSAAQIKDLLARRKEVQTGGS